MHSFALSSVLHSCSYWTRMCSAWSQTLCASLSSPEQAGSQIQVFSTDGLSCESTTERVPVNYMGVLEKGKEPLGAQIGPSRGVCEQRRALPPSVLAWDRTGTFRKSGDPFLYFTSAFSVAKPRKGYLTSSASPSCVRCWSLGTCLWLSSRNLCSDKMDPYGLAGGKFQRTKTRVAK